MSRKKNNGDGQTSGWAELDPLVNPLSLTYPDPGPRDLKDPDWVRKDRLFKESLPSPKYY
jgi:hypothetical protein